MREATCPDLEDSWKSCWDDKSPFRFNKIIREKLNNFDSKCHFDLINLLIVIHQRLKINFCKVTLLEIGFFNFSSRSLVK